MVLHANHPRELTPAVRAACARFIDAGIPMLSQTVLLRGVNDDAATLGELMRAFVECRIKPYYLHHADLARGTAHFRTTHRGRPKPDAALRGRTSGLCQPTYVLDIPGGHGKSPIGPNYLETRARALPDRGLQRPAARLSAGVRRHGLPDRRRGDPPARPSAAPGGRAFSRDVPGHAPDRRPVGVDRDLLPARARRALALASGRCGRGLALLRGRAARAQHRRARTGPRSCGSGPISWPANGRKRPCRPAPGRRRRASATGPWSAARWRRDLSSRASSLLRRIGRREGGE